MRAPPVSQRHPYFSQRRLPPRLVPTTYGKSAFRDSGTYDSRERLPDLDLLLDQTAKQIESCHDTRGCPTTSFNALWDKVCDRLSTLKNAHAYAHWKRTSIIKNQKDLDELRAKIASSWLREEIVLQEGGANRTAFRNGDDFAALREAEANFKLKTKSSADDVLQIAIAYWIEAKNARDESDELRAMHALIPCHLHIGITLSARTESEAKSAAGKKQGKSERDAIAEITVEVMKEMALDKWMKDEDYLAGKVAQLIHDHPKYSAALRAYDANATAGKASVENSTIDRFAATIRKWAKGKRTPYPEVSAEFHRIRDLAEAGGLPTAR